MQALFAAYDDRLRELIADLERTLQELPVEALDWSPGAELNSLAVLIVHTVGSTRYWIGDVVAGESSARVRETEFQTAGVDAESLRAHLTSLLAYVQPVLSRLTVADLEQERFAPARNQSYSVAYCLLHAIAHLAEHVEHAQMTRQLWEQRAKN